MIKMLTSLPYLNSISEIYRCISDRTIVGFNVHSLSEIRKDQTLLRLKSHFPSVEVLDKQGTLIQIKIK